MLISHINNRLKETCKRVHSETNNLLTPLLFQPCMTFILIRTQKENILSIIFNKIKSEWEKVKKKEPYNYHKMGP